MTEILVLCGLPGSGKTWFALSLENSDTKIIDVDKMMLNKENIEENLKKEKEQCTHDTLILDGLFLNHTDYEKLLSIFSDEKVIFHFWKEDRIACLYNDKGRREKSSKLTISYADLEKPDLKRLGKINKNIELVHHTIKQKEGV